MSETKPTLTERRKAAAMLGSIGGKQKARLHPLDQIRALGKSRRKPDDQITEHAKYMRDYRAGYRKRKDPKA